MILLETPIPRDWFDWSNACVGVVGLALTLWAVWQAKGAKAAAQSAEKSVTRHNAEVDFGSLTRMAKELHG
jgi:cytosine/uracil/thiamine/allantoin permease